MTTQLTIEIGCHYDPGKSILTTCSANERVWDATILVNACRTWGIKVSQPVIPKALEYWSTMVMWWPIPHLVLLNAYIGSPNLVIQLTPQLQLSGVVRYKRSCVATGEASWDWRVEPHQLPRPRNTPPAKKDQGRLWCFWFPESLLTKL